MFKEFYLKRNIDDSGVSGTGIIAHGAQLRNGWAILEWLTNHASVAIYPSIEELIAIHGHGGHTELVWGSPPDEK